MPVAPEATGPDERFVLWAQVAIGAEIDTSGTVRAFDASAWNRSTSTNSTVRTPRCRSQSRWPP